MVELNVLRTVLLMTVSALCVVPAAAQEEVQLETITVETDGTATEGEDGFVAKQAASATKTNTPIIETPQSISVVTSDQIKEQNIRSIASALRYVAGVGTEVTGARDTRYGGIEFRGFDATGPASFRDGLLLPYSSFGGFGNLDPYGAERIDVIKGPASVLYGQGSPGGLYNYVSKRPTVGPLREVEAEVGSFNRVEGRFDLSDRISEDGAWRYRLTGVARSSESDVDFVDDDRFFIAPTVEWTPNDDTRLTIRGNYQRDRAGWGLQFLPYAGTVVDHNGRFIDRERFAGEPDFDSYDTDQASLGYEFETKATDAITLRQNLRYSYFLNTQEIAYGGGYADEALGLLNRFSGDGESELNTIAIDNQAQAEFETGALAHTAIAGLDYRWTGYDDLGGNFLADPIDIFDPVYGARPVFDGLNTDSRVRQGQTGLYLQDQIKFDRLSVLLGGRYDFVDIESLNRLSGSEAERSSSAFTGRAAAIYNFDNGIAPYVSYSESFLQPLDLSADNELFVPETGRQWEGGVKFEPTGFDALFTVAVFDIVRDDVVRYGSPLGPTQSGQITSTGVELEAVVNVTAAVDLRAAYTYQDVRYTEDPDGGRLGNRPTAVPDQRASLWAGYTFLDGAFEGMKLGGGIRYVGSSFADGANTLKVPAFTVLDAAIGYERENFEVQLNVSNLLDEGYVTACFDPTFGCNYGEGRRISGKATIRW